VSWIMPPNPTLSFRAEELVAIRMPIASLAALDALSLSMSMLPCNRGSHVASTYGSITSSLSDTIP
jgi:hypothetical protein